MITVAEPIDADTLRIRARVPHSAGFRVSAGDVAGLPGVSLRHAVVILESLVFDGFLAQADGRYVRSFAAGTERR